MLTVHGKLLAGLVLATLIAVTTAFLGSVVGLRSAFVLVVCSVAATAFSWAYSR